MSRQDLLLILVVILLGCEEPADYSLNTLDQDLLVVEGMITNERKPHAVRLSRPIKELNDDPEPVSGATVTVIVDNQITVFNEFPANSGFYFSDTVQAVVNKIYTLYINYQDREYTATANMVPVTPLKPLRYSLVDEDKNLYKINFQDSDEPSIKEYWISWGHLPQFEGIPLQETIARTFHYSLSTIDVNQAFKPDKEEILFPAGSYVLRRKFSLSDDHQAFLRTFLSETEWRGSVFDVQMGNVHTNLSEGAIGYFAVSTVVADTTLILP